MTAHLSLKLYTRSYNTRTSHASLKLHIKNNQRIVKIKLVSNHILSFMLPSSFNVSKQTKHLKGLLMITRITKPGF